MKRHRQKQLLNQSIIVTCEYTFNGEVKVGEFPCLVPYGFSVSELSETIRCTIKCENVKVISWREHEHSLAKALYGNNSNTKEQDK